MRRLLLTMLGLTLATLGCGHTHSATDAPAPASPGQDTPPSDHVAEPAPTPKRIAPASPGAPPLFASPDAALAPEGLAKIQARLVERGELASSDASGTLDDATKHALIALQKKRNLPATGTPDDVTVRALGLDPGVVFRRADATKADAKAEAKAEAKKK